MNAQNLPTSGNPAIPLTLSPPYGVRLMEFRDHAGDDKDVSFDFRAAKIEHYLERAKECLAMSRIISAREAIDNVLVMDPENPSARDVEKRLSVVEKQLNVGNGNPSNGTHPTKNILLVDQDERVLSSLANCLSDLGYTVTTAGGFKEATRLLDQTRPDVIVSEVNFETGPLGFDLYLRTSTNARTAHIPFLFLATRIDRDILIAGKKLGVDDFILKPLDEEVVTVSIQNSLARKQRLATRP